MTEKELFDMLEASAAERDARREAVVEGLLKQAHKTLQQLEEAKVKRAQITTGPSSRRYQDANATVVYISGRLQGLYDAANALDASLAFYARMKEQA